MKVAVLIGLAGLPLLARAQVGIGTANPDAKAALEIKASDKGLLIPRLTASQRTSLTNVPQGLLVYQTDGTAGGGAQTGFWYYAGTPAAWVFLNPTGSFTLPYNGSYDVAGTTAFAVTHTGGGIALSGAAPNSGVGVYGSGSTGSGVYGTASGSGGYGVRGNTTASNSAAVYGGVSGGGTNTYGVIGDGETGVQGQGGSRAGVSALALTGPALLAAKTSSQTGRLAELTLTGTGNDSTGVYVSSVAPRPALRVVNSSSSNQAALRGVKTAGSEGSGVEGVVTSGSGNSAGVLGQDRTGFGGSSGVLGLTTNGYAVRGIASASGGYGVSGSATTSFGVIGSSSSGVGVYGSSTGGAGMSGVSTNGNGVLGTSSSNTTSLAGVQGVSGSGSSSVGVLGTTAAGYGVYGLASTTGRAAYFSQTSTSSPTNAVEVQNASLGRSLYIDQDNSSNTTDAVRIDNAGTGKTLYLNGNGQTLYVVTNAASSSTSPLTAVGTSSSALAGVFIGNVSISGSISKGSGSFKIDHPLDPENQYLYHSFVESPDMLNVYNGNVTLDARGEATVTLPDYFEALNRDFRYQLTPLGAPFTPYVLTEVQGNQFRIAGQPGGRVSWQVTGIRQDKLANLHRIPNAVPKEPENRGRYLHPEAFGQPAERGISAPPAARPRRQPAPHPAPTAAR